jgi:hypothetical protein
MKLIPEGEYPCRVLGGGYGVLEDGIPTVQIKVAIIGEPFDGAPLTYEEPVTNRQAPYIARSCQAVGWSGGSLARLGVDIENWIERTGGQTFIGIKHFERKQGARAGTVWAKPSYLGSRTRSLYLAPEEATRESDALMRDFASSGGASATDDPAHAELPFISQSWAADLGPRSGGAW